MTVRRFLRLLHKEWRDHRALILVWACLAPVLSQVVQWAFLDNSVYGSEITGRWILPALALFFLTALAAELVARESVTGVGDSLGRLPTAAGLLWITKIAFLASVGILSMTWLLAAELAWRALLDRPVAPLLEEFSGASTAHVGLVAGIALVFACGILVRNGFGAAILGLGVTFGLVYLLSQAVHHEWGMRPLAALSLWGPAWWAGVITVAALLASRLAYRPWRGGRGDVRRRCVLFGTGLVLILAPAGLAAVRRYREEIALTFHDPRVYIGEISLSPDRRLVALWVARDFRGWMKGSAGRATQGTWVLDLEDGSLRTAPFSYAVPIPTGHHTSSPWTADGELWFYGEAWRDGRYTLWDPRSGVSRQVPKPNRDWKWWRTRKTVDGHRFTWRERDIEVLIPMTGYRPCAAPQQGVVFTVDEQGRLLRLSLLEDVPRVLAQGFKTSGRIRVSPDGRRLAVQEEPWSGELHYLDAETGAPLTEVLTGWHHQSWTGREDLWAVCWRTVQSKDKTFRNSTLLIGEASSREVDLNSFRLQVLDSDRILVTDRFRGRRLLLVDGDGHTLQTLYEPEE